MSLFFSLFSSSLCIVLYIVVHIGCGLFFFTRAIEINWLKDCLWINLTWMSSIIFSFSLSQTLISFFFFYRHCEVQVQNHPDLYQLKYVLSIRTSHIFEMPIILNLYQALYSLNLPPDSIIVTLLAGLKETGNKTESEGHTRSWKFLIYSFALKSWSF